jgi:hypothetical protein
VYKESDELVVALWNQVFAYNERRNDPLVVIRQNMAMQRELERRAT